MAAPLRTFCVIPHLVRDDEAFEAVHEDHIVFDSQGKILTFDFSAVLSPAHNLLHNVLTPLFNSVRDRRQDAALLVSCPGSSGEACTVAMDLFANVLPLLFKSVPAAPIAHVSVVEISKDGKTLTDLYRMTRVHTLQELDTEEVLRASASEAWGSVMEILAQRGSWTSDGESAVVVLIRLEGFATVVVGDIGASSEILSQVNLTLRSSDVFERSGRTIAPRGPMCRLLHGVTQPGGVAHVVLVPDPMTSPRQTLRLLHFGANLMKDLQLVDLGTEMHDNSASASNHHHQRPPTDPSAMGLRNLDDGNASFDIATTLNSSLSASVQNSFRRSAGAANHRPSAHQAKSSTRVAGSQQTSYNNAQRNNDHAPSQQPHSWRDEIVQGLLTAAPSAPSAVGPSPTRRQDDGGGNSSMLVITPSQREQQYAQKVATLDKIAKDQKQKILALQNELKRTNGELHQAMSDVEARTAEAAEHKLESENARREQKEAAELVATLLKRISTMEHAQSTGNGEVLELKRRNDELTLASRKIEEQLSYTAHKLRSLEKKEVLRLRENTLSHIAVSPARRAPSTAAAAAGSSKRKATTTPHPHAGHKSTTTKKYHSSGTDEAERAEDDEWGADWDQGSLLHSIKQMRQRCAKLESENHDLRLKHQQEEAYRHAVALMGGEHPRNASEAFMVTSPTSSKNRLGSPTAKKRDPTLNSPDNENGAENYRPVSPNGGGGGRRVSQYLERECAMLRQQVQQVTEEIGRVQKDKDELQQLLALHPARIRSHAVVAGHNEGERASGQGESAGGDATLPSLDVSALREVSDVVHSVAHSIASGCQSLIVQLQVIASSDAAASSATAARSPRQSPTTSSYARRSSGVGVAVDSQTKLLITQHTEALRGIKNAIEDIVSRRVAYAPAVVPSTAAASDCEALSHLLTFEVERLSHLRAFIPTFGQLHVAVEHIKMRCNARNHNSTGQQRTK